MLLMTTCIFSGKYDLSKFSIFFSNFISIFIFSNLLNMNSQQLLSFPPRPLLKTPHSQRHDAYASPAELRLLK